MKFEDFTYTICSQINSPSTVSYGDFRTGYLKVLEIKDGYIVELGEIIFNAFIQKLVSENDLIVFGQQCEKFRIGERENPPSYFHWNGKMIMH